MNPKDIDVTYEGDEADRAQLIQLYADFWSANNVLDTSLLPPIWDSNPNNVFFNTNGHPYYGLDDWYNIWNYYGPRMRTVEAASPGDVRIKARGDMALITDDRVKRRYEWFGENPNEPKAESVRQNNPRVRMTMVAERIDGIWKAVHCHFSARASGDRPEMVATR